MTKFDQRKQRIDTQTNIGQVKGRIGHIGDVITNEQATIIQSYGTKRTITRRQAVHPPATYVPRVEIEEKVCHLLTKRSESQVSVFLTGLPRSGVSTTAQSIATALEAEFEDGTLWGDVQSSNYEEILWRFIEPFDQTLDRTTLDSAAKLRETLGDLLREKQVLIVLDHVISMADVEALVPRDCPHVAALIVSRTALPGTVGQENWVTLPELSQEEAIQLFRNVWKDDATLQNTPEEILIEIAGIHHFMPADMMIAAKDIHTAQLPPEDYLADIRRRQRGEGTAEQTYKPVFRALYDRLPDAARNILPYLGVLGDRWDLGALIAVSPYQQHFIAVGIEQLRNRFLIDAVDDTWYSTRPIIRDFALAKLREAGDEALVWSARKLATEHFLHRYQQIVAHHSQIMLKSFLEEESRRAAFVEAMDISERDPDVTFDLVKEKFEEVVLSEPAYQSKFLEILESDPIRDLRQYLSEAINWTIEQEDWPVVQRVAGLGLLPTGFDSIRSDGELAEISASFCYFRNLTMQGPNLAANFRAVRFINSSWLDCKFLLSRLIGVEIRNSTFVDVDMVGAVMPGLVVYNSSFINVDARYADLRGATFYRCSFNNVNLLNANAEGAQFIDCSMNEVDRRRIRFR